MIDEELYKIATDELNSDQRKADVWARACALASDDHDEARFLYTNLRVEEMLNTDGKQRTFNADRAREQAELSTPKKVSSLELDLADTPVAESSRTGVDSVSAPLPIDDIVGLDGDDSPAPSSVSGNAIPADTSDLSADTLAELDSELGELTKSNTDNPVVKSSLTGEAIEPSETTSTTDHPEIDFATDSGLAGSSPMVAELLAREDAHEEAKEQAEAYRQNQLLEHDSNDDLADSAPTLTPEQQRTSELTQNLEQQADALDEQDELADVTITANGDADEAVLNDYADFNANDDIPALDSGHGRSFLVFERSGMLKAVKRGVSWPALFFTFPWLLTKQLFGTAVVYGVLWIVSLGGLLVTASQWAAAGPDASNIIKLWPVAFGLLALIGLFYLPFKHGNRWVAEKLQNRGFELKSAVGAANKRDAIDRLLQHLQ